MLFLLGIDSAFSFMEGFLTVIEDTKLFGKIDRKITSFVLAFGAFVFSVIYATDAGLIFLDTIDYYINFVMLLVGGFECFSCGWIYKIEDQIENLGSALVFTHMCTFFGSVIVACVIWYGLHDLWAGFVGLASFYVLGMMLVGILMNQQMKKFPGRWTWRSIIFELMFKNIADLKSDLGGVVGYLPFAWTLLIKFFIPPIILVLFGLSCDAENSNGQKVFGHYSGYVTYPYQVLGLLCVVFTGFLFISSLIAPQMYSALQRPDEETPKRASSVYAEPQKEAKEREATDVLDLKHDAANTAQVEIEA